MRSAVLVVLALAACGGGDSAPPVDAAPDALGGNGCGAFAEQACLARDDCQAAYQVTPCENVFGYCAQFLQCDDGAAACVGNPSCERVEPFCAGPYVISYRGLCYGPCVRADQCAGCRTDKLSFTQATGCANDGSVEFCIPPVLEQAVTLLAPTVHCAAGGGRAGCDPASQLLCTLPTDAGSCTSSHGALTDDAWGTVCALSQLPDVTAIVPTIFE